MAMKDKNIRSTQAKTHFCDTTYMYPQIPTNVSVHVHSASVDFICQSHFVGLVEGDGQGKMP